LTTGLIMRYIYYTAQNEGGKTKLRQDIQNVAKEVTSKQVVAPYPTFWEPT
jgi:hypothetical protein